MLFARMGFHAGAQVAQCSVRPIDERRREGQAQVGVIWRGTVGGEALQCRRGALDFSRRIVGTSLQCMDRGDHGYRRCFASDIIMCKRRREAMLRARAGADAVADVKRRMHEL
jgi:hypothetical protein